MMKRMFEQLRAQLGWQGMSGIFLFALAGTFSIVALDPLEQEASFMHSRLDGARSKAAMQSRTFSLGDRQQELGRFFDSLPAEEDVTDILAKVYAIAEASGVGFKQAEYHLEEGNNPRLEYKITFPVQGDYARVRNFVAHVLAEHPAISLDHISFQRDKVNDPVLKADILLTVFLRPAQNN